MPRTGGELQLPTYTISVAKRQTGPREYGQLEKTTFGRVVSAARPQSHRLVAFGAPVVYTLAGSAPSRDPAGTVHDQPF